MSAGLPGTGIGGLFYIAGALWMPVDATLDRLRRRPGSRPRQARGLLAPFGIAAAILVSLWLTGWGLGYAVAAASPDAALVGGGGAAATRASSIIRWAAVVGSAGLLLCVVLSVQLLRWLVPRAPRPPATVIVLDEVA